MSIQSLYKYKFNLYEDSISSRNAIGGLNRTLTLKSSNISCYFTHLSDYEQYTYGLKNIEATHRLFCDPIDVSSTDIIKISNRYYNIKYIDNCNNMGHHYEILLLINQHPLIEEYSSSSSSSMDEYMSSSSSSELYSTSSISESSSNSSSSSSL